MRTGAGIFLGVVVEMCVRLAPVAAELPVVLAGYSMAAAPALLSWYRDFSVRCTKDLQVVLALGSSPVVRTVHQPLPRYYLGCIITKFILLHECMTDRSM